MSGKFDGGLRRTVSLPCSKVFKGTPREVNGKVNIHIRHCAICKEEGIAHNSCSAIAHNGSNNGWNGILPNRGNAPTLLREQEMSLNGFQVSTPSRITDDEILVKEKDEVSAGMNALLSSLKAKGHNEVLVLNVDDGTITTLDSSNKVVDDIISNEKKKKKKKASKK